MHEVVNDDNKMLLQSPTALFILVNMKMVIYADGMGFVKREIIMWSKKDGKLERESIPIKLGNLKLLQPVPVPQFMVV